MSALKLDDSKDIEAIKTYTDKNHKHWNNCKRYGIGCDKVDKDQMNRLIKVLDNAPKYQGTIHRGIGFKSYEKYNEFINSVQKENIYQDKGFLSTSYDIKQKDTFTRGKYKVYIKVTSKQGVAIGKYSLYKKQKEVLFKPDTKFIVKNVTKKSGVLLIELEDKS
ncbi:MAG: ADP-ribosyltransferase [Chitinophagales bacterium]|nr:ADP-ribosyltransferase [Chitinophagales bacterium]